MKSHPIVKLSLITIALLLAHRPANARPYKDSPIKTIIVPYYSRAGGNMLQPYQFPRAAGEARHVFVPETMEVVPKFNLQPGTMAMSSANGTPLNFADGAYPVYYMPGNANGRFNGKISLLV